MSFAFPKVEAETGIPITGRDATFMNYHSSVLYEGSLHTMGGALTSWISELFDNSEKIDAATANKEYGLPDGGLVFDEPVTRERAQSMRERHELLAITQAEIATMGDVGIGKGISGFIAGAVGGMMHPVDFSMNFIPFVGQAKLVKAGMGPMSRSLTRGLLLSEETIARNVTFPRITSAVIDATAGNLLAEIPVAIQARRNKEEYEIEDFARNILGGAVVAGTLKGLSLGFTRARDARAARAAESLNNLAQDIAKARENFNKLSPEIRDRMNRDSIQQMAVGKSPNVHSHATIDPKLMEAEWKEREAVVRAEGMRIAQADPELKPMAIDKIVDEAKVMVERPDVSASDKAIISRLIERVEAGFEKGNVDASAVDNIAAMLNRSVDYDASAKLAGEKAYKIRSAIDAAVKLADESTDPVLKQRLEENITNLYKQLDPAEVIRKGINRGNEDPRYQAFVKERIDKYVAEQKKLFDVEYQKKLAVSDAAREKQAIGPLAKPEDIAKLDGTRVPEAAIADIAEDARALSADAEADLKVLEVENPELADHIRKTLKEQMDVIDSPEPKAIEAAMRCLINE